MAGTEQDPARILPYSYEKDIDYANQVVEDLATLLPGVGVLIDPARLRGSAIEKQTPYYIPMYGLRIYGKNPDDVIKVAAKVDPKKFKTTATLSREVSTAVGEKKSGFFGLFKKKKPTISQDPVNPPKAPASKRVKQIQTNAQKKYILSRKNMTTKNVNKEIDNLFNNTDAPVAPAPAAPAPVTQAAPAPAAAAPAARPPRKQGTPPRTRPVNRGTIGTNPNATQKLRKGLLMGEIKGLARTMDPSKANELGLNLPQPSTNTIESFNTGKAPNSFFNESEEVPAPAPAPAPAKKTKKVKAPLSQEAIKAARNAAKAARQARAPSQEAIKAAQAAKAAERAKQATKKRTGFTSLFQGGSRKMRKPKRGARTFRKK